MDMLYQKYSNPLEFIKLYINQGSFGEFVAEIINLENKHKKEELEKENEEKLWQLYLHSMPDKSFDDWRSEVLGQTQKTIGGDVRLSNPLSMSKEETESQKQKARNILKTFSMS